MVERSERSRPERVPGTFRTVACARVALALPSCGALVQGGASTSAVEVACNGEPLWVGGVQRRGALSRVARCAPRTSDGTPRYG